jgi:hypothetical protein
MILFATTDCKLFGDKGYLSKALRDQLRLQGDELITHLKANMKNQLMLLGDKLLRKRSIVETIIDQLKNISQIEHTRHRSPINFMVHLACSLTPFSPKSRLSAWIKPSPLLRLSITEVNYYGNV